MSTLSRLPLGLALLVVAIVAWAVAIGLVIAGAYALAAVAQAVSGLVIG